MGAVRRPAPPQSSKTEIPVKDTKLAQVIESGHQQDQVQPVELRSLDDLELALVGGGDSPPDWP